MAETKRRGWLSRLLGGKDVEAEAETSVASPPTPGVQALDLLFGQPGGAPADAAAAPGSALPAPGDTVLADPAPPATGTAVQPPLTIESLPVPGLAAFAASVQLRITAHVSNHGDLRGGLHAWVGERGGSEQVEGLALTALDGIDPDDLEYLALLDDGTVTEWHRAEAYCGTRGAARPLHGYALRLVGPAAAGFRLSYAAVFADGTEVGPVADSELCAAASRAPLQAIYVMVDRLN